jgi:tetratricopeptide (TPR) repeat protein
MVPKMSFEEEIKKLYDERKYVAGLALIRNKYADFDELLANASSDILVRYGWLCYQTGDYSCIESVALRALEMDNTDAIRLLAHFYAYIRKDEEALARIYQKYPDDLSIINAKIIFSRNAGSKTTTNFGIAAAVRTRYIEKIEAYHIMNNAAQAAFTRPEGKNDTFLAIMLWEECSTRYSVENDKHHLAALYFWLSKAYESVGFKEEAIEVAEASYELWREALEADPGNSNFEKKLQGAEDWLLHFRS